MAERMIEVNAVQLCTEPFGNPADAPILLVMGLGASMLWWEDGFEPRRSAGFVEAMREALDAYAAFAGAERIEWARHLGAERRLFVTRS